MNPRRYISAALTVPLHVAIIWFGNNLHLAVYFGLFLLVGSVEFFDLMERKGLRPRRLTVLTFGAGLLAAVAFVPATAVFVMAAFAAVAIGAAVVRRDNAGAVADAGATVLSFVYPGALVACLLAIGVMESGRIYLIILTLGVWAADAGAYFAGKAFGRHALAPRISPKKTVEGLVGGAAVGAVAVFIMTGFVWPEAVFGYGWRIGLAVIIVAGSVVGDLAESVFKRDADVKDSGGLLPGHGGVLDRFDGAFVCAPLIYVYLNANIYFCR